MGATDLTSMKILIIGKHGQVSWELQRTINAIGALQCLGRPELDLANLDDVRMQIRKVEPDVLINAAAYTAVDKAELEPEAASKINAEAPRIMAEEMKRAHGLMVHYSSDFVYDGTKAVAYRESDPTFPLNAYGASKLAGDQAVTATGGAHLIFRTSWVYGTRGKNFLKTILRLADEQKPLRIVNDQRGAPTWSRDIATATTVVLAQLKKSALKALLPLHTVAMESSGVYHLSAAGETTWCGFACAILEHRRNLLKRSQPSVTPIATLEDPTPARRPSNSVLNNQKLRSRFAIALPGWSESLTRVMEEIAETEPSLQRAERIG